MAILHRVRSAPRRAWRSIFGSLNRIRVGTRVVLLLLAPLVALLLVTGIANWRGANAARELERFQRLATVGFGVTDIAESVSGERALSVRARIEGSEAFGRDLQAARVDRKIASVTRSADASVLPEDVGGRLDAVRRQLFAVRLRSRSMPTSAIQRGYSQAIDTLGAIERDLTGQPPTRDVATTVFADLAMQAAVEAARREQLDVWALLSGSGNERDFAAISDQWAELEQAALNSFRGSATSSEVADLGAALFSSSGLAVRGFRAQLNAGTLTAGSAEAARWWQQSGARVDALSRIRNDSRAAVARSIAADLSTARTSARQILAWSVVLVIVVLVLGLLLRRSIARSLRELARGAQALSAGDLDVVISMAGNDEIAVVGEAFAAVRTTNRQLVDELQAMNRAIAAEEFTRRADPSAFRGSWANVLEGMNGTIDEVARLHGAATREVERQKAFALVGRRVVSGLGIDDAYRACCKLLIDHVGASRAEVYSLTMDGWQRLMIAGEDAAAWPPEHDFGSAESGFSYRSDASLGVVRTVGERDGEPVAALAAEFSAAGPLQPGDELFIDGVARLLAEASHRRRMDDTRLRAQKLEATGTMAAAVAHDFNNVLGAILMNARLGERQTRGEESAETFAAIAGAVGRASEIVDRLLGFARSEPPARDELDLTALIDEACALLRPGLPSDIELSYSVAEPLEVVVGDPARILQVLVNLITNAVQALGSSRGQITVTADETTLRGGPRDQIDGVATGRFARVRVHDTGPGIPESVARRVFDPFFTTKPKGEGTGLGLASALTIARDHDGILSIESTPGGGTTATLCLPVDRTLRVVDERPDGPGGSGAQTAETA